MKAISNKGFLTIFLTRLVRGIYYSPTVDPFLMVRQGVLPDYIKETHEKLQNSYATRSH